VLGLALLLLTVVVAMLVAPGLSAMGSTRGLHVNDIAGGYAPTRVVTTRVAQDDRASSTARPTAAKGDVWPTTASVVAAEGAPTVTESMIRDAMADAPLQSQQGAVSLPRVQSYVDQLAAGSEAPAIKVDGSIIVDGNHRVRPPDFRSISRESLRSRERTGVSF
jgi:hypothetical protein